MASREVNNLVVKGIDERDADQVERVLDNDEKESRSLTAHDCFQALREVIKPSVKHEQIGYLLLQHAYKVYKEETIVREMKEKRILLLAVNSNMVSIIKISTEKDIIFMNQNQSDQLLSVQGNFLNSLLLAAFRRKHTDILELLIAAGCSPRCLLKSGVKYSKEHKETLKVLAPHLSPVDVMQSVKLARFISKRKGLLMLKMFEDSGVNFTPCVSSNEKASIWCMTRALIKWDMATVQFLLEHQFDPNARLNSKPLLHHLIDVHEHNAPTHAAVLAALKKGANPLLNDPKYNKNAIEAFVDGYFLILSYIVLSYFRDLRRLHPRGAKTGYEKILNLLVCMGFRLPKSRIRSQISDNLLSSYELKSILNTNWWRDFLVGKYGRPLTSVVAKNSSVPSLQSLCRLKIRLAKGGRTADFMAQLQYPQKLKDFILLKDIDFEEFELAETS